MTEITSAKPVSFLRAVSLRQVRLACGLVLFAYLVSHFLNHALGNISLKAMAIGVHWHMEFWQFGPVAFTFYGAATIHIGLGIWALYERRQFHRKAIEPLQLILGLSIPALIVAHIVGMRLSHVLFEQERGYEQAFYTYWVSIPIKMWLIYLTILISWVHGCIGLYFWLRLKGFFQAAAPWLLALAVLIPTLALLGLYQGGRTVVRDSASPEWQKQNLSIGEMGTPPQQEALENITNALLAFYLALLVLALAGRAIRFVAERRAGMIRLSYSDSRTIRVPVGLSILEASLRFSVPHASVCGGRARCSTCRIRVIGDTSTLPAPSPREAFVLGRIGVGTDPAIRLACQLRPTADLSFFQLLTPHAMSANAHASRPQRIGQERYLVSMFVDMRGSTILAEHRLPFDTVFIVNRFLAAVSQAVSDCGGQTNQFIGDGALVLFGLACDPPTASRQALRAAAMIGANIEELNKALQHDLPDPLRFGIGIHGGEVIIGDIGYRDHMVFTALGDSVNVAARLQDLTKSLACEAIVSQDVCTMAGLHPRDVPSAQQVAIRGRLEPMAVHAMTDARMLAALVAQAEKVAG
ncbi:adenylate/guanylate cyclase domain-containing protein [Tardiphaga sp.]|uniref:adenylate/guanylate cyclase domain-containing protein n=1 Tax=Tardiphaga sp. TaxID=1926292 RepID=UPI00260D3ABD|nr:adenylate/guanylate cyclase domain-containing protein [Tardiphaga sp.]MDB5619438.1 adenylate/guanylate cyclase protein [Tardiphaga sp.]